MRHNTIINAYFNWMYNLMCEGRYDTVSFRKLFRYLHDKEFRYRISYDANRFSDGVDLRYRFSLFDGYEDAMTYLEGPCSVLEMIVALAIRCEETIMDDPQYGDRTGQWFWGMIVNLGLGDMTDDRFDDIYVDNVIERFLDRDYEADGRGGLFIIKNCDHDLRDVEIWHQLCWYLNTIL